MGDRPSYRYVPAICRDYNTKTCSRPDCTRPHLCFQFFDPTSFCRNGKDCQFSHNIMNPQAKTCLIKAGFNTKLKPGEVRNAYVEALKTKEQTKLQKRGKEHHTQQAQRLNKQPASPPVFPSFPQGGLLGPVPGTFRNIPRICANFNQGICSLPGCDLLHICQPYIEHTCVNDFKTCPFSHDIFRPDIKQKLAICEFNVNQKPKQLIEDYRQALRPQVGVPQVPPSGPRLPSSGKNRRGIGSQMKSMSAVDVRGPATPKGKSQKPRRPKSQDRRNSVSSNASKCDDAEKSAESDNSDSSTYDEGLETETNKTKTKQKKGKRGRGGRKKGKQQGTQESESPETVQDEHRPPNITQDMVTDQKSSYKYIPSVCRYYNMSSCTRQDCTCPHLCSEFFSPGKTCPNGIDCKFSHNIFNPHAKQCLETAGFVVHRKSAADLRAEYIEALNIKEMAKETLPAESSLKSPQRSSKPDVRKPHISLLDDADICLDFLSGKCAFGEVCKNHHQVLPYLWQYRTLQQGVKWGSFSDDNVQLLEQSYCNVNTGSCSVIVEGQMFSVDFDAMTATMSDMSIPVRRLSTASYVNEAKDQNFVTGWTWFWESDNGWVPCGQKNHQHGDKKNTKKIQTKFEEGYQNSTEVSLKINGFAYKIYFSNMKQQNCESGTERRLRRRPGFMSPDEVKNAARLQEMVKQKAREENRSLELPDEWSPMLGKDMMMVDIKPSTTKFSTIKDVFQLSMPTSTIILIKRVQNPTLWFTFRMKSDKLGKEYGPGNTNERRLFHGTSPDAVDPICEQNFDWRLYGSAVGARYGKGAYFAIQANKADQ